MKHWQGSVLDASKEAPTCPQFNSLVDGGFVHGQEDCLYLNVYVPQVIFKTFTTFINYLSNSLKFQFNY